MSRQEDMSERALCMLCYLILYEIYDLRIVEVEEELKQRQEGWLLVAGYRDRLIEAWRLQPAVTSRGMSQQIHSSRTRLSCVSKVTSRTMLSSGVA